MTPTPDCQHLRLKPNVSAETSVIAIGFRFWGVTCEDCGRKWDVGQVMQAVVDLAASERARQRAETIVDVSRRLRAVWARRGHGCAEEKLLLADLAHAVDALAPDAPKEKP